MEVRLIKFVIETHVVCAQVTLLYKQVLLEKLAFEALILLASATQSTRTLPR